MWRMVRFLECTDKMCRVPFCMYGPSRPCSRDAAHGAFFGVYREDVPCAILHAWAGQACAAEMRRTVRFLECTEKMCHVPFCMHGPSRPVQQRCGACCNFWRCTDKMCHVPVCMHGRSRPVQQKCGARCNFWSVQTRRATCHSACMGRAGRCSRDAAHGAIFTVYRPDQAHAILHAWAG